jgi:hypothetical protein
MFEELDEGCALCGGPVGVLGVLGRKTWCLCRDCGAQFSVDTADKRNSEEE